MDKLLRLGEKAVERLELKSCEIAGRWVDEDGGWRRRRKVGRGKRTSEGGLVWFRSGRVR